MRTDTQAFFHHRTTPVASLRRVLGVDLHDLNPGLDSLVVEEFVEDTQSNIVRNTGEGAITKHELEVQVFNCNQAIAVDQLVDNLVPPITALIGDVYRVLRITPEVASSHRNPVE